MASRIIIDTNVLVAATGWQGTPNKIILSLLRNQDVELIMPQEQYHEALRVLRSPRFSFGDEGVELLHGLLSILDRIVKVVPKRATSLGAVDDILLDAAEQYCVNYLITGDAGLLQQKNVSRTKIISPEEFAKTFC